MQHARLDGGENLHWVGFFPAHVSSSDLGTEARLSLEAGPPRDDNSRDTRTRMHTHTRLQTNCTAAAPPCRTQADKLAALHNNTHARPHSGYIKYVHMHMCARGACTWTLMELPFLVSLRRQLPAALWIVGRTRAPPLPTTTTTTLRYAALWGKWRQAYTTEWIHPEEGAPL